MTQYNTSNVRHNAIVAYARLMNVLSLVRLYRELEEVCHFALADMNMEKWQEAYNEQVEIRESIKGSDYPEYVAYVS